MHAAWSAHGLRRSEEWGWVMINEQTAKKHTIEFTEGTWYVPQLDGPEPSAVVAWAGTRWMWWALGRVGQTDSYDDARAQCEAIVVG